MGKWAFIDMERGIEDDKTSLSVLLRGRIYIILTVEKYIYVCVYGLSLIK